MPFRKLHLQQNQKRLSNLLFLLMRKRINKYFRTYRKSHLLFQHFTADDLKGNHKIHVSHNSRSEGSLHPGWSGDTLLQTITHHLTICLRHHCNTAPSTSCLSSEPLIIQLKPLQMLKICPRNLPRRSLLIQTTATCIVFSFIVLQ